MTSMASLQISGHIDYASASDRFSGFRLSSPISVCYQVTTKCNYSCPHCLSSSGPHADHGLSSEDAHRLIDVLSLSGVKRINMTGGEPLLRKDLPQLCEHASDRGIEVVLTSNGSFFSERITGELKRSIQFIQISIDGPQQLNDQIRHPGAFQRAVTSIKKYLDAGVEVRINCTLQNLNVSQTGYVLQLAHSLGVKSVYFIVICAQGRAASDKNLFCFEEAMEREVNAHLKELAKTQTMDVKILDFRRYEKSCVLVGPRAEFISQGWGDEDCILAGNLLEDGMEKCWNAQGVFDHLLHLIKNVRHPLLYS